MKSTQTKYYEKVSSGVSTGLLRSVHYNNICTFTRSVAPADHIGLLARRREKFSPSVDHAYIYISCTHTNTRILNIIYIQGDTLTVNQSIYIEN